jgi:hypothetical protein
MLHHLTSNLPVEAFVLDAAGNQQLRPVVGYEIIYEVQQRLWLGKFQPDECRGLVNYLDGQAFTASHLPVSAIPMQRDQRWEQVADPDRFALTARGTVVLCMQPVLVSNGRLEALDVQYLGLNPPTDAQLPIDADPENRQAAS